MKKFWRQNGGQIAAALLIVIVFLLSIPFITYLFFAKDLQSPEGIMNKKDTGVILLDRKGKPFYSFYQGKVKEYVPLSEISPFVKQSIIVAEDREFYSHPGFSLKSLIGALIADSKQKSLSFGGSTITQQLVKHSLLNPKKDFLRKYQELILAAELERRYSKDKILEMYLNSVYFGEGAFGIEDASLSYFGKKAQDLDLSQASLLAALLPAPSKLSPISGDGDGAFVHQKNILTRMVELGVITQDQKEQALAEKLTFNKQESLNKHAIHFALMVRDKLIQEYGEEEIARSGFKVKTSIDLDLQEFAQNSVSKHVDELKRNNVSNGAAVVENPKTGQVLALVGSKDWYDEKFGKVNITTSLRSPGSAFKPLVYATAFENRKLTPASMLDDSPITYQPGIGTGNEPYSPIDYDRRFRGKVLVRRALVNSLNVPAVQVLHKVGIPAVISQAQDLGITTLKDPENYGLSFALGAAEVKLLELTNAYSAFANLGNLPQQTFILEIKDKYSKLIYQSDTNERKVLEPGVAFQIASILSDNATRAEVFGNALNISRQAAVKTGTAEDYRDALTIGFTPSVVVGVWVGNNSGEPMDQVAGSLGAAPIWKDLMEYYLKNTPIEKFEPPDDITSTAICKNNGLLLKTAAATSSAVEYFLKGTEPTKLCVLAPPPPSSNSPQPTTINSPPTDKTPPPAPPPPSVDDEGVLEIKINNINQKLQEVKNNRGKIRDRNES